MVVTAQSDATRLINARRIRDLLGREGLDAVIAAGFENVVYLTGYCSPANWFLRETRIFAIAAGGSETVPCSVVLPISQVSHYLEFGTGALDLIPYGRTPTYSADSIPVLEQRLVAAARETPQRSPTEALRQVLAGGGLLQGRVGLDIGNLTHDAYREIAAACPGVAFVPATALLREIRAVKTPAELLRLREAARIAQAAITASARATRAGMTELDLASIYEQHVITEGGRTTFACIGFGERGAYSNVTPSRRRLRPGDLIRYDVGCTYEFYHCDMARTFAFGRASRAALDLYRATLEGERRAVEAALPGATGHQVFTAGVEGTRRAGIAAYERAHCGHAIGLEIYEYPLLAPGVDTVLEPGMVLAIETPYYELGTGGFQPEDIVLVTEQGCELLTTPDENLVVLD
jgi:Xaa-Pro dipeptidase